MAGVESNLELISGICREGKLAFSPETATAAQWTEFLAAARNKSAVGVNHPTKGAFWRSCQAQLPDLAQVANDPEARAAFAASARAMTQRRRDEARAQLAEALELMRSEGPRLEPGDRVILVTEYILTTDGLLTERDLDELLQRLGMSVGAKVERVGIDLLPPAEMARLKADLAVFEVDSLFAFLGMRMDASCPAIATRITALKSEWSTKRDDHRKTAAASCLAAAERYLADPNVKRQYEVSWANQRLTDNKYFGKVRIAARDGMIDAAECEQLIASADGCGVERSLALDVLRNVAAAEGYRLHEPAPAVSRPAQAAPPPPPVHTATPMNQPVSAQPQRPSTAVPRPVPTPVVPPGRDSGLMTGSERASAAICYLFPPYSFFIMATKAGTAATRSPSLNFAAYQAAGLLGIQFVLTFIMSSISGPVFVITFVVLAAQAARGVPAKVPGIGNWAMRMAA